MPVNRIQLGKVQNGATGTYYYGMQVSQPGDNVLDPSEPLIFNTANVKRTGQIYAGGNQSSTSSINWTTTKGSLGYTPLVIQTNDAQGDKILLSWYFADGRHYIDIIHDYGAAKFTSSTITFENAEESYTATNTFFIVLRIPCAYGIMPGSYGSDLWS